MDGPAFEGARGPEVELLLAQAGWVRRLALHLVQDRDRADDLIQETWRRALERRDVHDTSERGLRAWLARVLRNLAADERSDADLRRWHESSAGRPKASSIEGVAERILLQRQLAEAVFALEEPYRSAITHRYFEELSAREIAEREGTTPVAVRQRIARGIAMLRARLDRDYGGDRAAWCGALLALASPSKASVPNSALLRRGLLMGTQVKLVAVAAGIAIAALLVWRSVEGDAAARRSVASRPETGLDARSAESERDTSRISAAPLERSPAAATDAERPIDRDRDLHGVVLDPSDHAVAGAKVAIDRNASDGYEDSERSEERDRIAETTTNAEGRFAVALPIGRPFDVEVDAPGFARAQLGFRYAGEQLTIRLQPGASVFGRVTSASDGNPMPGTLLELSTWIFGHESIRIASGVADAEGRYRFDGLPAWKSTLRATPPSAGAFARRQVELAAGQVLEENFSIEEGRTIRGRVVDAASGTPIPGAEVGEAGWVHRMIRADANGEYVYRGIRAQGPVLLRARAPGHGSEEKTFRAASNVDDLPERFDFQLAAGRVVRGRVVASDGSPIAGVRTIAVASRRTDTAAPETDWIPGRTDASGAFELRDLRSRLPHSLVVRKDGFGTLVYELPSSESESPVVDLGEIVLPKMAVVRGKVVDGQGAGRPDWEVTLTGANADRSRYREERDARDVFNLDYLVARRTARTDDLGRFAFADLAAGEFTVEAGFSTGSGRTSKVVHVAAESSTDGVELALADLPSIAGTVTDADGRGIAGVGVNVERRENRAGRASGSLTDASGAFRIEGVPEGLYDIRISGGEFKIAGVDGGPQPFLGRKLESVSSGTPDLKIVLEPGEWILGRVVDADGSGVEFACVEAHGPNTVERLDAFTAVDGRFRLAVPKGAAVDLEVRPPVIRDGKPDRMRLDADPAHAAKKSAVTASPTEIVIELPRRP